MKQHAYSICKIPIKGFLDYKVVEREMKNVIDEEISRKECSKTNCRLYKYKRMKKLYSLKGKGKRKT